jgi:CRP/FNR family cyclic AMP-dependent transcriptional regulator
MGDSGQPHFVYSSNIAFSSKPWSAIMTPARKAITLDRAVSLLFVADRLLTLRTGAKLFSQGARADAIFFIRTGKVTMTVLSEHGKEAVLRVLGPHEFLGEECLLADSLRTSTATTSQRSTVFRIGKRAMLTALHRQSRLAENFVAALLARNVVLEESLRDQLLNHAERRRARALLMLGRSRNQDCAPLDMKRFSVTHATLAGLVGESPARIGVLMERFRALGLIDYTRNGELTIMTDLLVDLVVGRS